METASKTSATARADDPEIKSAPSGEPAMSNSLSLGSYAEYPWRSPFMNAPVPRSPYRPTKAFPESSCAVILSALRNLQEKIRRLERERNQAEHNLRRLATHTSHSQSDVQGTAVTTHTTHDQELVSQISAAESRCQLLEKQLDYMRMMVRSAESERTALLKQQVSLEKDWAADHAHVQAKFARLDLLEKEYQKLTATQNQAERKIGKLERKLLEEEEQRKLVQDKAAQLQMGLEASRALLLSASPRSSPKSSRAKHKTAPGKKPLRQCHGHAQPHYMLRLGDVPFVAGTSTGSSHSVRANVQHVLHLMKQHNRQLCNNRVLSGKPLVRVTPKAAVTNGYDSSSSSSSSSSSCEELTDLLQALQDEFGHLNFEHQELVKQVLACRSDRLRRDLELEMEETLKKLERKGEQITKVRRHQVQLEKLKRESQAGGRSSSMGRAKGTVVVSPRGGALRPRATNRSKESLHLLRDMQSLQTSLQKEQLQWEY